MSDFELFDNTDRAVRARKFVESIKTIQQIWSQDPPYDIKGEFRNVSIKDAIIPKLGIGYMPKPFQKPGPPIATSLSSRDSPTAKIAAQARMEHYFRQQRTIRRDCLALADL